MDVFSQDPDDTMVAPLSITFHITCHLWPELDICTTIKTST